MSRKTLTLPPSAMKNLARSDNDRAFVWKVGSTEYKSTWMCAEASSPKIAQLRATDPTVAVYDVGTPDPDHQFEAFVQMSEGSECQVDESNYKFFLNLFRELCNWDQYWFIRVAFGAEPAISENEPLDPELLTIECDEGVKFWASNFWRLTRDQFKQFPLTTLEQVLSHESLQIMSEDSLYDFISHEIPTNRDYLNTLRFVRFDCLSGASISRFIPLSEDYWNLIDLNLWKVICRRLELPVETDFGTRRWKEIFRPLDERDRPDGIISCLSRGWDILPGLDFLKITMKSVGDGKDREAAAAAIAQGGYFRSKDKPNQWVCWELQLLQTLRPTPYSFSSSAKSWILEGSLDGVQWTEIDRRAGVDWDEDLSRQSFEIFNSMECKFIRLTQTDKNINGRDILWFQGFELFGRMWETSDEE